MNQPLRITVIGAGLMGHGIAWVLASAGHEVAVFDRSQAAIDSLDARIREISDLLADGQALPGSVAGHKSLPDAATGADFVFEAAPEKLELKRFIMAELESVVRPDTIIASNTSALPITHIAANASVPERIVGAHFWNPPHLVKLVEVVQAERSDVSAVQATIDLLRHAGHHAVHVRKDIPGFIGNRLQHALKREAIALVAAGVCDAETVDDVVKHGFGKRLGVLGPLEQSDMVGLELTRAIHATLMPDLDRTAVIHPYLDARIAAGHTGMSAGQGFRTWTDEEAKAVRDRLNRFLAAQARDAVST